MNIAWFHVLIVHLPVLGSFIVFFLGFIALKRQSENSYKTFYWMNLFVAITASIAYFTGPETALWIKEHTDLYSKEIVENHALWGRIAFSISILSGLLGVMAITNYAQEEKPHKAVPWVVMCITCISIFIFIYTAHLGGLIRRPDIL